MRGLFYGCVAVFLIFLGGGHRTQPHLQVVFCCCCCWAFFPNLSCCRPGLSVNLTMRPPDILCIVCMNSLALFSAKQMPLSKARPADAVGLISEEQQQTDWQRCSDRLWTKWVGSWAYIHMCWANNTLLFEQLHTLVLKPQSKQVFE